MKKPTVTLPRAEGQTLFSMLFDFLTEHLDEDRIAEPFPINFSEDYYEELINAQKTILPSWNDYDKKKIVRVQLKTLAKLVNTKLEVCYGLKVVKNIYPEQKYDEWILIFYEPLIGYTSG